MKKLLIVIVSLLVFLLLLSFQIQPTIQKIAKKEMDHFIQLVINHVSFISDIDEDKLFENSEDSFQFNMVYINSISSDYIMNLEDVLLKIQEEQYDNNSQSIYNQYLKKISQNQGIVASIPLGAVTENVFFENIGPRLHVKYRTKSLVSSHIQKNVKSYGINHILVSIDLTVTIELQILIPFQKDNYKKQFQVPLVLKIIEGEVPSWYQDRS